MDPWLARRHGPNASQIGWYDARRPAASARRGVIGDRPAEGRVILVQTAHGMVKDTR
jgi:hypothetical protein